MTEKAPITQVAGALPAVVVKPPEHTRTRAGVSSITEVLATARGGLDRGANTVAVGANPQTALGCHTSPW
jgi:hypothetical protein